MMRLKFVTSGIAFLFFNIQFCFATNTSITLDNASTAPTGAGVVNAEILRVTFTHLGGGPNHNTNVTAMNFTPSNSDNADVLTAKLYHTTTSTFSTVTLLATDNDLTNGISFSGFSEAVARASTEYFWLAYDVAANPTACNVLSGSQVAGDITISEGAITSYTDNASGSRKIPGYSCSWVGNISNDWGATANWDGSVLPASGSDVYIPSTAANMPLISGDDAKTLNLYVQNGATLTVTGTNTTNTLKTYGNIVNNGTIDLKDCSGAPVFINGTVTISGTGSWTTSGTTTYSGFDIGYNAASSVTQQMDIKNLKWFYNSGGGTGRTYDQNGYYLQTYRFGISSGNTFNAGSDTLEITYYDGAADYPRFAGTYNIENGTIWYNITDKTYIVSDLNTYYNLILTHTNAYLAQVDGSTGDKTCQNLEIRNSGGSGGSVTLYNGVAFTVNGNLTIGSNCDLNAGTSSAKTVSVKGNFTNNGTLTGSTLLEVIFDGSAAQVSAGSSNTTFYNLTVNNTGLTGSETVTLNTNANVSNILTLTDGHLVAPDSGRLTLGSAATVSPSSASKKGGSSASFVSGYLDRVISVNGTEYEFPMGNTTGNIFRPLTIKAGDATTRTWTVQTLNTNPNTAMGDSSLATDSIGVMNTVFYHQISHTGAATIVDLKMWYEEADIPTIDETRTFIGHWSGAYWDSWDKDAAADWARDAADDWIQVKGISSFSPGGPGKGKVTGDPLPVELLYFSAAYNGEDVILNWATASEINNDYFTIEKSIDVVDLGTIAKVTGAGNNATVLNYFAVDKNPYYGTYYYRLKQTDFDGKYKYSDIIPVKISRNKIIIEPNPARDYLNLTLSDEISSSAVIDIYNSQGILVYHKPFDGSFSKFNINISFLNNGLYLIRLSSEGEIYNVSRFVKE